MRLILIAALVLNMMNVAAQTVPQTNQHFSHTATTSAPSQRIWNVWTNVSGWKDWDTGLKDASMDESFGLGAKGLITSLENRTSKFKITAYTENISYTMKTKLPLGSLHVTRYLSTQDGLTVYTHEVQFKGLTKGIFAKAFGSKFRDMLPGVLDNIKKIVEE